MLAHGQSRRGEAVAVGVVGLQDGPAPADEIGHRHRIVAALIVELRRRGRIEPVEVVGEDQVVFREVVGLAGQQA